MSRLGKIALGFAAVLGVAACVFLGVFLAGQGLDRASLWAAVLGLPVGAVATAAGVWAPVVSDQGGSAAGAGGAGLGGRPAGGADAVVTALVGGRAGTVGITTGLYGAGGFGKTTLAQMVCADRRVQAAVRGRGVPGDGGPGCAGRGGDRGEGQ